DKYGAVICQYTHQINDVLLKWSAAGNQTGAVTPTTTPPSVETTTQPPVTNPPINSQPTTEPQTTDNVVFIVFNLLASLFGF
ncbi:trypsin, partial [Acinetobacter baumannii]